jgi:hypothetical protein
MVLATEDPRVSFHAKYELKKHAPQNYRTLIIISRGNDPITATCISLYRLAKLISRPQIRATNTIGVHRIGNMELIEYIWAYVPTGKQTTATHAKNFCGNQQ